MDCLCNCQFIPFIGMRSTLPGELHSPVIAIIGNTFRGLTKIHVVFIYYVLVGGVRLIILNHYLALFHSITGCTRNMKITDIEIKLQQERYLNSSALKCCHFSHWCHDKWQANYIFLEFESPLPKQFTLCNSTCFTCTNMTTTCGQENRHFVCMLQIGIHLVKTYSYFPPIKCILLAFSILHNMTRIMPDMFYYSLWPCSLIMS